MHLFTAQAFGPTYLKTDLSSPSNKIRIWQVLIRRPLLWPSSFRSSITEERFHRLPISTLSLIKISQCTGFIWYPLLSDKEI
jgi:hypothetical protein